MRGWTPRNIQVMVISGIACLCLLILVTGTVIGVIHGSISAEMLGNVQGAGIGGGLLGLGVILLQVIKVSLGRAPDERGE